IRRAHPRATLSPYTTLFRSISRLEAQLAAQGLTRTAIVDAVAQGPASTANLLSTYFNRLDTSVNGLLDFNEMKAALGGVATDARSEEHTSELQSRENLVCRL